MRKPRVVIVGAGPGGSACALALAQRGTFDVLVIDKSSYPRVKVCGSGLSPTCLDHLRRLGVRDRFSRRAVHMRKLLGRGPDGHEVLLAGAKGAWVVPRVELDHGIVSAAEHAGARFMQETKVTRLLRGPAGEARGVETQAGEIEADIVVCANGSPSRFSTDRSAGTAIRTIMGWWRGASLPEGQGNMSWDRRLHGYYAWAFPEPDGIANVGITIPEDAAGADRLKELFAEVLDDQFGDVLRGADPLGKWMGHPAVVTTKIGDDITESRAIFVGEAARLVSPGTVEGISFALESGIAAADVIDRHFEVRNGMSRVGRAVYRATCRARMLPKFWAGEALARLMRSERARTWSSRVISPQWLASRATALVGEQQR
jgi:flavin-dependent dehydrogenase